MNTISSPDLFDEATFQAILSEQTSLLAGASSSSGGFQTPQVLPGLQDPWSTEGLGYANGAGTFDLSTVGSGAGGSSSLNGTDLNQLLFDTANLGDLSALATVPAPDAGVYTSNGTGFGGGLGQEVPFPSYGESYALKGAVGGHYLGSRDVPTGRSIATIPVSIDTVPRTRTAYPSTNTAGSAVSINGLQPPAAIYQTNPSRRPNGSVYPPHTTDRAATQLVAQHQRPYSIPTPESIPPPPRRSPPIPILSPKPRSPPRSPLLETTHRVPVPPAAPTSGKRPHPSSATRGGASRAPPAPASAAPAAGGSRAQVSRASLPGPSSTFSFEKPSGSAPRPAAPHRQPRPEPQPLTFSHTFCPTPSPSDDDSSRPSSRSSTKSAGSAKSSTSQTRFKEPVVDQPPSPRHEYPNKRPTACLLCKSRKIACGSGGRPNDPDQTCNQCLRKGLKCEYPPDSRRRPKKKPCLETEREGSSKKGEKSDRPSAAGKPKSKGTGADKPKGSAAS